MASATTAGVVGAAGRYCKSAASTPVRRADRYEASAAAVSAVIVTGETQRGRRRLQLASLVEDLDAAFGVFEACVAETRQLHAAFVELQGFLQGEIAVFELLDDDLEFGNCRFEVLDGGVHF